MIQTGDLVKCVITHDQDANFENLTFGKTYDVITSVYGNWIQVINDDGEEKVYPQRYFEKVLQSSEMPPGTTSKNLEGKPHLAYLDPHLEYEMGIGMSKGAIKHGRNNHRELTVEAAQEILDSVKRHLNSYLRGEKIDPELQINHLACVVNNLNFIYRLDRLFGYDEVLQNIYGKTL